MLCTIGGRVLWAGLQVRAQVDGELVVVIPDEFSIRHTTARSFSPVDSE